MKDENNLPDNSQEDINNNKDFSVSVTHNDNVKKDIVKFLLFLTFLGVFFFSILIVFTIILKERFPNFEENLKSELTALSTLIEGKEKANSSINNRRTVNSLVTPVPKPTSTITPEKTPKVTTPVNDNHSVTTEVISTCNTCGSTSCVFYKTNQSEFVIENCFTMEDYLNIKSYLNRYSSTKTSLDYYNKFYDTNGCLINDPAKCYLSVKDTVIKLNNDLEYYKNQINKILEKGI